MRILIIIASGLLLLTALTLIARYTGKGDRKVASNAAKFFVPIWFCAAATNMYVGVAQAGYSAMKELPIFLIIFGLPAIVAIVVWRKFSH
ncbi:MAG: hypothetical protein ABL891_04725 [Burkholderiales bacterium]